MKLSIHDPNSLNKITSLLMNEEIVILPCDTIYGICGKAPQTSPQIAEIKGRNPEKPFLMLIKSESQIKEFSDFEIPKEILNFWPGALTLIIPGRDNNSYGFRIPDNEFLQNILGLINFPLYSTSVNRESQEPLNDIEKIISDFENQVSLIVEGRKNEKAQASTILNLCTGPFKILRQGDVIIPQELLDL